ncbi:hypothetical protein [Desulfurococcus amylolyticus]|uniref:Uncharacterized protein n=1 Tax=Desulfurococcus amylolyticus DSM 16532 TaxID=768672 RepID=I3XQ01_DESAM|nr:hypothetical protein [Desulfurococcus amylolyticus]AFL66025.1 hypothetical protein Desfe_0112 [Desulfurococcus amylolyticus DSM 16532]
MISNLAEFLKRYGFTPVVYDNVIRVFDEELPVYLEIKLDTGKIYTSIGFTNELREVFDEISASGEDVEEAVDEALSRLNECALLVKKWAESRKLITIFELREGSAELLSLVEEYIEGLNE